MSEYVNAGTAITARDLALERELDQLTHANNTIARLINSIQTTLNNVQRMNSSANNTDALLDQWVRILSQTQFTSQIINDQRWDGSKEEKEEVVDEVKLVKELEDVEKENKELEDKIEESEVVNDAKRKREDGGSATKRSNTRA